MDNYYAGKLNAGNLLEVYNTDIGRVRQYLEAEIDFICSRLHAHETVLELGTGYGRILKRIAPFAKAVVGSISQMIPSPSEGITSRDATTAPFLLWTPTGWRSTGNTTWCSVSRTASRP